MTDFYYKGNAPKDTVQNVIFHTPIRAGLPGLLEKTVKGGTWYFLDDAVWHSILSYMSAEDAYGAQVLAKGITLICDPNYEFPVQKYEKKPIIKLKKDDKES